MAPAPIWWQRLEEQGRVAEMLALMDEEADTPEARARVYLRFATSLRDRGQLCEHPEHQPPEWTVH